MKIEKLKTNINNLWEKRKKINLAATYNSLISILINFLKKKLKIILETREEL